MNAISKFYFFSSMSSSSSFLNFSGLFINRSQSTLEKKRKKSEEDIIVVTHLFVQREGEHKVKEMKVE